ncbi:hypothetical protein [Enterocloster citroniae]|uniref:hypothetical protein n=1 Tax=Enterocloster citroniae TaxID=358743 RepID=UPI00306C6C2C|nr:hypothetical protein [Enterocloster citroniae]
MATVDEILTRQAYAAGDEMWTKDNNYPSYTMYAEPEYVPVTNKRIADFNDQVSVRGEQNAQFVGFQLPRYDDAMDLTKQNLYIHYQTAYGGSDGVPCNVSWLDNYVRMCWMIPGQATQEPGSIQMMIYATGTNSVGDRTVWKTLPATYTIHDGLEIGGGIPEPDQSWYEQFVAQMEGKVSTAQGYANDAQASKVAAAGSATAAAQSATESAQALQENKDYVESQKETFVGYNKRETDLKYANALIGSASGTGRVTVGDAWEAPIPDLEVAGKSEQVSTTGAQLLQDSNIYPGFLTNANGTRTNDNNYRTVWLSLPAGTYTLSVPGGVMIVKTFIDGILNNSSTSIADGAGYTCALTQDGFLGISFRKQDSSDYTTEPQVMLNTGSTALPWEPYTGGKPSPSSYYRQPISGTGTVTTGVQMLDLRNGKSGTVGGITYTNVGDGTYKRTGTVTSSSGAIWFLGGYNITPSADDSNVIITLKKGVEYIAKDCWLFWFLDNAAFSCEEGKPFTPESDIKITGVRNPWQVEGSTYNDVIRPTLVEGNTVIWEPYTGGNPSPSEAYPQPLDVTVTGEQLFDAIRIPNKSTGGTTVTNNGDGSMTISGTGAMTGTLYTPVTVTHEDTMALIGNERVFTATGNIATYPYFFFEFWDKNGVVMRLLLLNVTSVTKSLPAEADMDTLYIKFGYYGLIDSAVVSGTQKVMVNAGSTALPWKPYQSKTATIQLTAPLYGIGEYRDRIMCKDGEWGIERQFAEIRFDGSADEKWGFTGTNDIGITAFYIYISNIKMGEIKDCTLCNYFKSSDNSLAYTKNESFFAGKSTDFYLRFNPGEVQDLSALKEWLSHNIVTVTYPLATPTWEPLPAATQTALNALSTFTGTTHITITAGGPEPDVAVEYVQDTKAVIADIMEQINEIRGGTT